MKNPSPLSLPSSVPSVLKGPPPKTQAANSTLRLCVRILHPPPKSFGNARFCSFTALTFTGPIRSNPKLRAETCASGLAGAEIRTAIRPFTPGATPTQYHSNRCTVLQRVAVCCSVLHAKFFRPQVQHPQRISDLSARVPDLKNVKFASRNPTICVPRPIGDLDGERCRPIPSNSDQFRPKKCENHP
jgi:hypothetical protein